MEEGGRVELLPLITIPTGSNRFAATCGTFQRAESWNRTTLVVRPEFYRLRWFPDPSAGLSCFLRFRRRLDATRLLRTNRGTGRFLCRLPKRFRPRLLAGHYSPPPTGETCDLTRTDSIAATAALIKPTCSGDTFSPKPTPRASSALSAPKIRAGSRPNKLLIPGSTTGVAVLFPMC